MTGDTSTESIRGLFQSVYGADQAALVWPRLATLLDDFRRRFSTPALQRGALDLTQRDALLIAYGDMVREEGRPPLAALARFSEEHLAEVVSGVHILPHFPYTSDDGFSVTDYFKVDPALGSWDDVSRLGQSFDLMFDAVFNHMSAQGQWFAEFQSSLPRRRDFFVTVEGSPDLSQVVRPRALPLLTGFQTADGPRKVWTTFSADQVDLNFKNPEVFLATLEALLFYVEQGARFIRLDAIAYLWKEIGSSCIHLPKTHLVIQLWRAILDNVAPQVLLITETNVPHSDNISYFGDGSNEAQLVYNFALPPLVLHAITRGDASHLRAWAQSLTLPSDRVTFFNFLASHDGIGLNPARGLLPEPEINFLVERCQNNGGFINWKHNADGSKSPYEMNIVYFDALNDPNSPEPIELQVDRFMVAQAILLALRGMPGIYFHSLFGSRNDRDAALATGINRRINRQKFTREELDAALGDKQSLRAQVFGRFRAMLKVRRAESAFHPGGSQEFPDFGPGVFAILRTSPDGDKPVLCLQNVSGKPVGGIAVENIESGLLADQTVSASGGLTLQPYEVNWLRLKTMN